MTTPSLAHTHTLANNSQSKNMALLETLVGQHLREEVLAVGVTLKKAGKEGGKGGGRGEGVGG